MKNHNYNKYRMHWSLTVRLVSKKMKRWGTHPPVPPVPHHIHNLKIYTKMVKTAKLYLKS